ncbi:MAG: LTA synthase family protein [Muribaculaceae bacterium]
MEKLRTHIHRLRPWAFPMVAVVVFALMSMWMFHCNWGAYPLICVADGLCLVLPWLLLPPRWRGWWWILPVLYTITLVTNLCFGFFFGAVIPVELYLSNAWMNDYVVFRGVTKLNCVSLLPVGGMLLVVIAWLLLRRRQPVYSLKRSVITIGVVVCAIVALHLVQALRLHHYHSDKALGECVSDVFDIHDSYKDDILSHGYVIAYTYHFFERYFTDHSLTRGDIEQLRAIETAPRGELPAELATAFAANRGKNLICIVVESLDTDALGCAVGGVRITPTLDSIAADTTVIALTRIRTQIGIGQSSDGQVIAFGGLMRCPQCPIVYTNCTASLPSIFHALDYAHNLAVISEFRVVWNAGQYLPALGLTTIYDDICSIGYGSADEAVFDEAFQHISAAPQPFSAMVTTISMHEPYVAEYTPITAISRSGEVEPELGYYLERTHFFDACLAAFLRQLKQAGIYQQSVVVIVADHNSKLHWNTCIPAFILNSGLPHRFTADRQLTQLDIYPTLLDVMGLADTDYWHGMGYSALRPGLTPLTEDELRQRSVLTERLMRADYFGQSEK